MANCQLGGILRWITVDHRSLLSCSISTSSAHSHRPPQVSTDNANPFPLKGRDSHISLILHNFFQAPWRTPRMYNPLPPVRACCHLTTLTSIFYSSSLTSHSPRGMASLPRRNSSPRCPPPRQTRVPPCLPQPQMATRDKGPIVSASLHDQPVHYIPTDPS